jgi:hypothetical protein
MGKVKLAITSLLVLGVAAALYLSYQRDQNRRAREEHEALKSYQRDAIQLSHYTGEALREAVETNAVVVKRGDHVVAMVKTVTGAEFSREREKKMLPTRRVAAAAFAQPDPPAATEKTTAQPAASPAADDELPPGQLSREQIERMRAAQLERMGKKEAKKDEEPGKAPEGGAAPGTAAPARPPARPRRPVVKEPEIVLLAREIVFNAEMVATRTQTMREIDETVKQLEQQAVGAALSQTAGAAATRIRELSLIVRTSLAELREAAEKTAPPYAKALQILEQHEADLARRKEAEERIRKEAELHRKTQREQRQVAVMHGKAREQFKTGDYAGALAELKAGLAGIETEGPRQQLSVLIGRYERLVDLRAFVIRRINEKRYRWGWGQGAGAKDIYAADERGIQVTGLFVAWPDIPADQLIRILKYYVEDKDLERKEGGEQLLALGVYYLESERNDPARTIAGELQARFPTLAEEVKRLLL